MNYWILSSRIRKGLILKETAANIWLQEYLASGRSYRPERIFKSAFPEFKSFGTFEEIKAEMIKRMEAIIARRETELQSKREDLAELRNKISL